MSILQDLSAADLFSDESSFYGSEDETSQLEELATEYNPSYYWSHTHPHLLTTIQHQAQSNKRLKIKATDEMTASPMEIDDVEPQPATSCMSLPPDSQGRQESVSDFLARLPPSTTKSTLTRPWIYASNPHVVYKEGDVASLVSQGTRILRAFENEKAELRARHDLLRGGEGGSTMALNEKLRPLQESLERSILSLMRETGVVTGKWMLFISPNRVDQVWGVVAHATARGELGFGAKVATDDGTGRMRLIAIYTWDFEDRKDVRRVLERLMELGVVERGKRPVYYKCDAFTHLDIMSNNPYGLKASLFSSADILACKSVRG